MRPKENTQKRLNLCCVARPVGLYLFAAVLCPAALCSLGGSSLFAQPQSAYQNSHSAATFGQPSESTPAGGTFTQTPALPDSRWTSGTQSANDSRESPVVGTSASRGMGHGGAAPPAATSPVTSLRAVNATPAANSNALVVSASYESPSANSQSVNSQSASPVSGRTPLQPRTVASSESTASASGSTARMVISVVSSLAVVIGLFLGVAMLYRKSLSSAFGKGLPKTVVQVLGRSTVAPRQQLLVVRFGSKLVLVSMLQGEARTLSEITDPLEVDNLTGLCESSQSGSITQSFREILTQGTRA